MLVKDSDELLTKRTEVRQCGLSAGLGGLTIHKQTARSSPTYSNTYGMLTPTVCLQLMSLLRALSQRASRTGDREEPRHCDLIAFNQFPSCLWLGSCFIGRNTMHKAALPAQHLAALVSAVRPVFENISLCAARFVQPTCCGSYSDKP